MRADSYTGRAPTPTPRQRIEWREQQLKRFPVADMSKQPKIISPAPAPARSFNAASGTPREGHCQCGARLGRAGKCPALCAPVEQPAKVYTGPHWIGPTHLGRMAAPVRSGCGWIG